MTTALNSCEFLRERVGCNWVIARRTANIVRRYGEDVVCLSSKAYDAIMADYNQTVEDDIIADEAKAYGVPDSMIPALRAAYRRGVSRERRS